MERQYFLNELQQKLVEDNMSLVGFVIKKYICSMPFEYDDMVSIGYIGLCIAAATFSTAKNHTFSTYAVKIICRTIWREFRHSTRQKRGGFEFQMSLNEAIGDDLEYMDMIVDNSVDVEFDALNKVICADLWNIVPTYTEMESKRMNGVEYARMLGVANSTITERKKREFKAARKYLFSKGVVAV